MTPLSLPYLSIVYLLYSSLWVISCVLLSSCSSFALYIALSLVLFCWYFSGYLLIPILFCSLLVYCFLLLFLCVPLGLCHLYLPESVSYLCCIALNLLSSCLVSVSSVSFYMFFVFYSFCCFYALFVFLASFVLTFLLVSRLSCFVLLFGVSVDVVPFCVL